MVKIRTMAEVIRQDRISEGIYSLWLSFPEGENLLEDAVPGQFVSLYCRGESRLLPRPISICEIRKEQRQLRLVYRIAGEGTREFSEYSCGDRVSVMGPLGNGFMKTEGSSILIGGGIGIPPMLALAKDLAETGEKVQVVLGYRDGDLFLSDEFAPYAEVFISTEDGSVGTKGNVIDAIREKKLTADRIYACGPLPMLRGVKAFAASQGIPAQISMEERMACGIGACLSCVCKSGEVDAHSQVRNKRVCKEGPVFDAQEIEI